MSRSLISMLFVIVAIGGTGCVKERPENPAFALTIDESRAELCLMREDRVPLSRPVIFMGGFGDPGLTIAGTAGEIRKTTSDPELVSSLAFILEPTMEAARASAIAHALERHAGGDETRLAEMEFDVVGYSMGGLVARSVAMAWEGEPAPLRVRRIFTISTPHLGAKAAVLPGFDRKIHAMRAGSDFLRRLDEGLSERPYELLCYVRLGDGVVGHQNAAPRDHPVLRIRNKPYAFAHLSAGSDPRLIADIARRLRDEPAYADPAGSPLPVLE